MVYGEPRLRKNNEHTSGRIFGSWIFNQILWLLGNMQTNVPSILFPNTLYGLKEAYFFKILLSK